MRSASTLSVLAALASTVVAQGSVGLPPCAGSCLGPTFGGCGRFDVNCICSNKNLISDLSCCVLYNCNADEQKAVITFADSLCGSNGVHDLPTAASCSAGQQPTGAQGATPSVTRTTAAAGSTGSPSVTSTDAKTTGSSSGSSSGGVSQTSSPAATTSGASSSSSHAGAAPTAQIGLGGLVVAGLIAAL